MPEYIAAAILFMALPTVVGAEPDQCVGLLAEKFIVPVIFDAVIVVNCAVVPDNILVVTISPLPVILNLSVPFVLKATVSAPGKYRPVLVSFI
jgi:hypothetical protein